MERAPQIKIESNDEPSAEEQESTVENLSEWRALREQAPQQAAERMEKIADFEGMSLGEQVTALEHLQDELAAEGNQNRFISRVLANEIAKRMDVSDAERAANGLSLRSPYEQMQRPEADKNETEFPEVADYAHVLGYTHKKIPTNEQIAVDQQQELSPGQERAANYNRAPLRSVA